MPSSVLEAIEMGVWDFEPVGCCETEYDCTLALPGSDAKLDILANRLRKGLPLWHSEDRRTYDDTRASEL